MTSTGRTIVFITGANTGIGLETVKALLTSEREYHVLLGGRDIKKAELAAETVKAEIGSKSEVTPIQIDVESDESIQNAHDEVAEKFGRIDCLINNAGKLPLPPQSTEITLTDHTEGAAFDPTGQPISSDMTLRQAFNKTWDVNVTGAHIVTLTFLPLLLKSQDPRLLFITSGASSLHDSSTPNSTMARKHPAGLPKTLPSCAYRASKTGLNLLMLQWFNAVAADGVKVWAVAPGFLATGLGGDAEALRQRGAREPRVGGEAVRGVVERKRDGDVGRVVREYGDTGVIPW